MKHENYELCKDLDKAIERALTDLDYALKNIQNGNQWDAIPFIIRAAKRLVNEELI